jgi:hypothetical protein
MCIIIIVLVLCVGITDTVGPFWALLSDRGCYFYGFVGSVSEASMPVSILYHLFYAATEHQVYRFISSRRFYKIYNLEISMLRMCYYYYFRMRFALQKYTLTYFT